MGIVLLAGAFLAWAKRYAAHRACQAAVLILNLPMIALAMRPSLHTRVVPRLSGHLWKRSYAIATGHGVLGVGRGLRAAHSVSRRNQHPSPFVAVPALEAMDED